MPGLDGGRALCLGVCELCIGSGDHVGRGRSERLQQAMAMQVYLQQRCSDSIQDLGKEGAVQSGPANANAVLGVVQQ